MTPAVAASDNLPIMLHDEGTLVAWGIPLRWTRQSDGSPCDAQRLHLEARSGRLLRVRPGVFAPSDAWNGAFPVERYLASVVALALTGRTTPVFCRETALALHGVPLASVPAEIRMRASSPGAAGRTNRSRPAGSRWDAFSERRIRRPQHWARTRADRANSENQESQESQERQERQESQENPGIVLLTLAPGFTLAFEELTYCLSDTVHRMHYLQSTVALDALKGGRLNGALGKSKRRQRPWNDSDFSSVFALTGSVAASERLRWALDFSSGAAESPQESMSRVRMHQLGFATPALQHTVLDQEGFSLGDGDFWWESARVLGECDGKGKYAGAESYSGRDASEVVYAEKLREDRIREQGITVVRWGHDEVKNPRKLEQKLLRAGVPKIQL